MLRRFIKKSLKKVLFFVIMNVSRELEYNKNGTSNLQGWVLPNNLVST